MSAQGKICHFDCLLSHSLFLLRHIQELHHLYQSSTLVLSSYSYHQPSLYRKIRERLFRQIPLFQVRILMKDEGLDQLV